MAVIEEFTLSKGVDVVLECAGAPAAAALGLEAVRKRGRFVQVGLFGKPVGIDLDKVVTKEIFLVGSFSQKYLAWERAIELAGRGKIDVKSLITDILPLSEWRKGFEESALSDGLSTGALWSPMDFCSPRQIARTVKPRAAPSRQEA